MRFGLLASAGFPASMHDISAEAGISVGLIYRYFENKEAVISGWRIATRKKSATCWNARAGANAA